MQAKLTTVSEIHVYPSRPEGYAEPLFHSVESRKEILEHFAESGWLWRASEARRPEAPRLAVDAGTAAVSKVLAIWREVDRWWEPEGGVDVVWRLVETRTGGQRAVAAPASAS